MLTTINRRDIGTAAIVLGLLGALVTGQGVLIPALLVLVGVGLRIEAALSAGIRQHKPSSPRLASGAKLTALMVLSQRLMLAADRSVDIGRTVTVDVARGGSLVLVV